MRDDDGWTIAAKTLVSLLSTEHLNDTNSNMLQFKINNVNVFVEGTFVFGKLIGNGLAQCPLPNPFLWCFDAGACTLSAVLSAGTVLGSMRSRLVWPPVTFTSLRSTRITIKTCT